jgi:hypothetical protein
MITKIYQIKETCPMWSDGSGIEYERLLPQLLTKKEDAELFKENLYILTCEQVTCLEFEIIELEISDNYLEDVYDFHKRYGDIKTLENCGGL